jgi:hypothetical protein
MESGVVQIIANCTALDAVDLPVGEVVVEEQVGVAVAPLVGQVVKLALPVLELRNGRMLVL